MDHLPDCSASRAETGAAGRYPRRHKLLRHADFQRVYQQGQRHFAAHMTVFYAERKNVWSGEQAMFMPGPRVGLTVGRVLGGAVQRNRIKRRMREAVRAGLKHLVRDVDVVINPKKSALTAEFAVLRQEVARAFEKIQSPVASRRSPDKGSGASQASAEERK